MSNGYGQMPPPTAFMPPPPDALVGFAAEMIGRLIAQSPPVWIGKLVETAGREVERFPTDGPFNGRGRW